MNEKQLAGEKAASYIDDGMIVGLGTGSTVRFTIEKVAKRIKEEGLRVKAVSTSIQTTTLAESLGIPLFSLNEIDEIDVTIDGADEVDGNFNGIKGGGGALLFEKIVAAASKKNIWVTDSSKTVTQLGRFPLPVEVVPMGYRQVFKKLKNAGCNPEIRKENGEMCTTDSDNYIIDLHLEKIEDPKALETMLNMIPGVVENGLFINRTETVIVGKNGTTEVLNRET